MRGKRSKQYRKLMQQYGMTFGFREPYQVLVDAGIIQDAARFKMDLLAGLERTLHGKVKPMITQCSMRHLYTLSPPAPALIDQAKTYERRRCNHHELENPLSTLECLSSVVDPKGSHTNKHRYVVASQDMETRAFMRGVAGVPLVYINRSVMIMEPMAGATAQARELEEKGKLRAGLKSRRGEPVSAKRKREANEEDAAAGLENENGETGEGPKKKKKTRGPKGPNPLSVKKPKKKPTLQVAPAKAVTEGIQEASSKDGQVREQGPAEGISETQRKRKRRRKHKSATADETTADSIGGVMTEEGTQSA